MDHDPERLAELDRRIEKLEARAEDAVRLAGAGPRPTWRMCLTCDFVFCVGAMHTFSPAEIHYCPGCGSRDLRVAKVRESEP